MSIHSIKRGQLLRPARQALTTVRMPAPIKGLDARVALTEGAPLNCVYNYNIVPFEYGIAVRKGYREHQKGIHVNEHIAKGVHTVIPFDGVNEQGLQDRLFAVTNEGLWDVTVAGATPVLKTTFADQQPDAGYGVYTHYVDDAEKDVLLYADNINGLFEYDSASEVWSQVTNITGPVIADIRYIISHKQRLWMIEENSTKAWYLPIGSKGGQATEFFFGSKFKHGGNLEALFNWTVDGGSGVDDILVAVSRAGDVLPYKGADPSSADTWSLVGTYFVGEVPRGPFFGSEHGGELFILSEYGLTSMNDLLKGVDTNSLQGIGTEQDSISGAITGILRDRLKGSIGEYGWQVKKAPTEGSVIITTPVNLSGVHIQYSYNITTRGWGIWRGVPMIHFDSWHGAVVFGADNNIVYRMDTTVDNVQLTPPTGRINGDPIEFSLLTSYQTLGAEGLYKKVKLIRADFIADGVPEYTAVARYDYDIAEASTNIKPPLSSAQVWDVGLWDKAVWGSEGAKAYNNIDGVWGAGRTVAVAIKGSVREPTRLIGFDVMYTTGGPLL